MHDYNSYSVMQLREFARSAGIKYADVRKNALVPALEAWDAANAPKVAMHLPIERQIHTRKARAPKVAKATAPKRKRPVSMADSAHTANRQKYTQPTPVQHANETPMARSTDAQPNVGATLHSIATKAPDVPSHMSRASANGCDPVGASKPQSGSKHNFIQKPSTEIHQRPVINLDQENPEDEVAISDQDNKFKEQTAASKHTATTKRPSRAAAQMPHRLLAGDSKSMQMTGKHQGKVSSSRERKRSHRVTNDGDIQNNTPNAGSSSGVPPSSLDTVDPTTVSKQVKQTKPKLTSDEQNDTEDEETAEDETEEEETEEEETEEYEARKKRTNTERTEEEEAAYQQELHEAREPGGYIDPVVANTWRVKHKTIMTKLDDYVRPGVKKAPINEVGSWRWLERYLAQEKAAGRKVPIWEGGPSPEREQELNDDIYAITK